jgi:hypothetical protein
VALGFLLAEVVGVLQDRADGPELARALDGAYAKLRAAQDAIVSDSAAQEFRELLEAAGQRFPELTARCADLQSRLDEVLRLPF